MARRRKNTRRGTLPAMQMEPKKKKKKKKIGYQGALMRSRSALDIHLVIPAFLPPDYHNNRIESRATTAESLLTTLEEHAKPLEPEC